MKILLTVLLTAMNFCLATPSFAATNDPASIPDTFYVLTNRVEWKCLGKIFGPAFTNDVTYVVKNVQTNRTGVYVVSYPAQPNPSLPVIIDYLDDKGPRTFRVKTQRLSVAPNTPEILPKIDVVEHVEVTFGPFSDGEKLVTYFGYVDVGQIFYTGPKDILVLPIPEFVLRKRIGREK